MALSWKHKVKKSYTIWVQDHPNYWRGEEGPKKLFISVRTSLTTHCFRMALTLDVVGAARWEGDQKYFFSFCKTRTILILKVLRRRPTAFENVPAVPEQRPSRWGRHTDHPSSTLTTNRGRGRGFVRARPAVAAPVAAAQQAAPAPVPALPPPPPVFQPEPTGELVTGVECPEPEGLQVMKLWDWKIDSMVCPGVSKPWLLPPVLQVRQWHPYLGNLWQWSAFQRGADPFNTPDNLWLTVKNCEKQSVTGWIL